ncbi:GDSL esterase/lipase At4g10955-like [Cryptomeria japonica]|uniref:GDSL esterase/lipase At4g10955-like n=1 Tax=Cryptomeria japonica TaxID=3369 RepID=UPI0025AD7EC9|nr:GDSL esterase/lipase At4g10955-like [Cryptomeria japonica]
MNDNETPLEKAHAPYGKSSFGNGKRTRDVQTFGPLLSYTRRLNIIHFPNLWAVFSLPFDACHRRCIAASLVQGVYAQEWERQERRLGPDAQAEIWWSFFGFKLLRPLLDRVDGSIFGAVYKWSKKAAQVRFRPPGVPKIVVALRGTVPKAGAVARDLWLDLSFLTNELHTSYRFHYTLDVVKKSVRKHGSENVWIVGHSLGAAMGMLAGRKMAEEERQFLQAHLFNPPFVSPPVERIQNEKIKSGFYIARSVVTAGLSMTLQDNRS